MDGYWWGVLTPFAIILGILLLYLTGNLFGAIVSWAWKKAHYGLLKKGWIAEDYDEDSREWTTRPGMAGMNRWRHRDRSTTVIPRQRTISFPCVECLTSCDIM